MPKLLLQCLPVGVVTRITNDGDFIINTNTTRAQLAGLADALEKIIEDKTKCCVTWSGGK